MATDVYRPDRAGATIVFKPGVTREQAAAALAKIADVLDARDVKSLVHEFDSRYGGPVFYLP